MAQIPDFKEFLNGMGALVEMWLITYNNFKNAGLSHNEAIEHTKGVMSLMLYGNKNKEE